jgi:hypothetical protein
VKRILVVDDEPTILAAVATRLRAEDFSVDTAIDGPSAVATAAVTTPDLVVLDVMLPGFDGLEVCRRIQATSTATSRPACWTLTTCCPCRRMSSPQLQRLPEEVRQCAMYRDDDPDAWYEFNLSRSRVTSASTQSGDSCEAYWTSSS